VRAKNAPPGLNLRTTKLIAIQISVTSLIKSSILTDLVRTVQKVKFQLHSTSNAMFRVWIASQRSLKKGISVLIAQNTHEARAMAYFVVLTSVTQIQLPWLMEHAKNVKMGKLLIIMPGNALNLQQQPKEKHVMTDKCKLEWLMVNPSAKTVEITQELKDRIGIALLIFVISVNRLFWLMEHAKLAQMAKHQMQPILNVKEPHQLNNYHQLNNFPQLILLLLLPNQNLLPNLLHHLKL